MDRLAAEVVVRDPLHGHLLVGHVELLRFLHDRGRGHGVQGIDGVTNRLILNLLRVCRIFKQSANAGLIRVININRFSMVDEAANFPYFSLRLQKFLLLWLQFWL